MNLVIPYRNRRSHLSQFLNHYRESGFDIFIIEQCDDKPFNRGKLLNIGVLEGDSDYYIFHDVDMLAVDGFEIYSPAEVAHLAGRASQFGYKDPYIKMGIQGKYFGGVTLFSKAAFEKCDGYSNEFWGWGSEDDEMLNQVRKHYEVEFRPGRFRSLNHSPADRSFHNKNILLNLKNTEFGRPETDGLKACKYELISKEKTNDFTWVKVKL